MLFLKPIVCLRSTTENTSTTNWKNNCNKYYLVDLVMLHDCLSR